MSIDELRQQISPQAAPRRKPPPSWRELCAAIALAGGCYASTMVLLGLTLAIGGMLVGWMDGHDPSAEEAIPIVFTGLAGLVYGGLLGMIGAAVVAVPVLALVAAALKGLGWQPRWDRLGVFCGGLVGYSAMLPVSLLVFSEAGQAPTPFLILWLLGPGMAVFFGQVGGGIGGLKNLRRQPDRQSTDTQGAPFRFSLWQLLGVMAIVSVLLTLLRAAGLMSLPMLLATLAWLGVQTLGRRPALAVARWWRRRSKQQRRSEKSARRTRIASQPTRESSRNRST